MRQKTPSFPVLGFCLPCALMTKTEKTREELRALLRPEFGDGTDDAIDALAEYVEIVVRVYQTVEADPARRARLDALTNSSHPPTMTAERSFTNQYEKP